ncbi:MAG: ABC transporter ATP-binding protein [Chloroflexi bacterium]|nr:ABC transporter ATP-binding protein [Chloroflexota bacterium]
MPLIEVCGLTFKYVGRKLPTLQDVSLTVQRGESLLLLGPSGCGKSSLALALNGAIPHALAGDLSGSVRIDGRDTRTTSMPDLAARVGIVFQDPEAQFCMVSVEDEIAFGLENLAVPRAEMDARIDAALATVGLLNRRTEQIARLSGGQKQRLALACVLALNPDIVVLDEPTAQLDPLGAADVMAVVGRLRAEGRHTLVIVEHRLDEVVPLVDRAVVLGADGRIVADGRPHAVLDDHGPSLAEAGVWTPQVSELARRLRVGGVPVEPFPISLPEAEAALRPHVETLDALTTTAHTASAQRITSAHPAPCPLLAVRQVSYQYPRASRPVLNGVSLAVAPGELVAVVGANGAGKSTLARLIAGIVRPPPGAILLDGQDAARLAHRDVATFVGYVFQYPEHQFVGQTVLDDVAYGLRHAGVPESEALDRSRAMLADFGLLALGPAHPFSLSHGEQRRLSVASMLVLGQRLLLLDEPTFGQDQKNATMLLDKLEALAAEQRGVVAITHDMRLVSEHAQRVVVIGDGTVLFDGRPADLFSDRALLAAAHLLPPPLWELSQRLGLRQSLPRLDRLSVASVATALAEQPGRRPEAHAGRPSA